MDGIKTILTILLFCSLAWNIGLLAFAFSRKDKIRALYLSLLAMAILFYSLGYLLEINAVTSGEAMMALRIENIGIPLVTPFFLLTALGFYQPRLLRTWMLAVVAVYGVVMFLLIFFNDSHMLYYSSVDLEFNGSFFRAQLGKGPLYVFQQIISTAGMVLVYVLLAVRFIRGSAKLRSQMNFFLIGSLVGFGANIAYFTDLVPLGIDPMPFALTMGLVFFSIVLRKHKLMDIVPVAFNMAIENMDDAAIVLDSDWGFIYCNQQAKNLFPELNSFSGSEEIMRVVGWPHEISPQSEKEVSFELVNPVNGEAALQQASINDILDKLGKVIGVSVIIRDVTETTNMFRQIEELAITDHLTGVYNRRHFITLIERQLGMAQRHDLPVSILMLDIDFFKNVNDMYSHIAGDYVLRTMTQTIVQQMRAHDVIARYGGEEFVILSAEKDEMGLLAFANRLRKTIEEKAIVFEDSVIRITASFGAVMIMPGRSFADGMTAVDKALYEAKNSGRNKVVLGTIPPKEAETGISSTKRESGRVMFTTENIGGSKA